MKKYLFWLLILLGVCFFFFKDSNEEIRIRVISNSNSDTDLEYKNEVVKYLKKEILRDSNLDEKYFKDNQAVIEEKLNSVFDDIKVSFEKHTFRDKTYNGSVLENEDYPTLLIIIGEGMGKNWWGSIFDSTLQKESIDEVKYEWFIKR